MRFASVAIREPVTIAPDTAATEALAALLGQLRDLISLMPVGVYRGRPAATVSGSVGEHLRHCLDHVAALAASATDDDLSYDHRLRGTTLEIDPATAINEIERLFGHVDRLAAIPGDRPIRLASLIDDNGELVLVRSTLGREVAYVLQHTIHHCAMIALLLAWQGWSVPAGFGLAPSTARDRAQSR